MLVLILALTFLQQPQQTVAIVQQAEQARPDRRCTVVEVVKEGIRSDCGAWRPAKTEKIVMPEGVRAALRDGDAFFFKWQKDRWIAVLPLPLGYKRPALQADGYPEELRSTACLMSERKDVAIVVGLPRSVNVDEGTIVLLKTAGSDLLFRREPQGWLLLATFGGKWEAEGILLESGPCRIKPPLAGTTATGGR